jgi:hypothetical protein
MSAPKRRHRSSDVPLGRGRVIAPGEITGPDLEVLRLLDPYLYFKYATLPWLHYLSGARNEYSVFRKRLGYLRQAPNRYIGCPETQLASPNADRKTLIFELRERGLNLLIERGVIAKRGPSDADRNHAFAPHRAHSYMHELIVDLGYHLALRYLCDHDPALRLVDFAQLLAHPNVPLSTRRARDPLRPDRVRPRLPRRPAVRPQPSGLVTTSPRVTCPLSCPLRKSGEQPRAGLCYAEHGALGGHVWTLLDRTSAGHTMMNGTRVCGLDEPLFLIRALPARSLWRHNIAGDLASLNRVTIDRAALAAIVAANRGRRGFTFTHYDVLANLANRQAVADANGFTINLSGNALAHADAVADLRIAPVTVILPAGTQRNTTTPKGRTVVICPTSTHGVTCADCGLCARASRSTIIGFPASGGQKQLVK